MSPSTSVGILLDLCCHQLQLSAQVHCKPCKLPYPMVHAMVSQVKCQYGALRPSAFTTHGPFGAFQTSGHEASNSTAMHRWMQHDATIGSLRETPALRFTVQRSHHVRVAVIVPVVLWLRWEIGPLRRHRLPGDVYITLATGSSRMSQVCTTIPRYISTVSHSFPTISHPSCP